ncbi:MAG TPA: ABC transporter permease [Vicinamibacterales bacterium]
MPPDITASAGLSAEPVHLIVPESGWVPVRLGDLWEFRELLYFLTWRDIKVRYKRTALGVAWALIQPLMTTLVFTVFFGRFGKMPSDGLPYPVFTLCALLPWQLFSYALTESSNSVVTNERLITKVYFPRLLIPMSTVLAGLADFAISFVLLGVAMAWFGVVPGPRIVLLPLLIVMAVATALGVGLWLSALNVQYRDVRYTLAFLTQFWLLATPVAYSSTIVPEPWRALLGLNPMAGVVEGFRWALLGTPAPYLPMFVASIVIAAGLLVSGTLYFRRMERGFVDVI